MTTKKTNGITVRVLEGFENDIFKSNFKPTGRLLKGKEIIVDDEDL